MAGTSAYDDLSNGKAVNSIGLQAREALQQNVHQNPIGELVVQSEKTGTLNDIHTRLNRRKKSMAAVGVIIGR